MHEIISVLLKSPQQRFRVGDFIIWESPRFSISARAMSTKRGSRSTPTTLSADTLAEQVHDPNGSATVVNGLGALLNSHPVEHPCCLFLEITGSGDQGSGHKPFLFCESAAKGIENAEG